MQSFIAVARVGEKVRQDGAVGLCFASSVCYCVITDTVSGVPVFAATDSVQHGTCVSINRGYEGFAETKDRKEELQETNRG